MENIGIEIKKIAKQKNIKLKSLAAGMNRDYNQFIRCLNHQDTFRFSLEDIIYLCNALNIKFSKKGVEIDKN